MKTAFRVDHGSLRRPSRTPQGFLRVDGYASRVGVFEYLNEDGSVRRELRLPEEVFREDALAGFEGAPLTDGHPPVMVTADNVGQYERGTVTARARRDGDFVVTSIVIKDAKLIRKVERGDTGLSVGYAIDLDETPGVHPVYGRYDAIQRNLVINHLAAAVTPRAGNAARIRMDDVGGMAIDVAVEMVVMTTAVDGHQHTLCPGDSAGRTSYAYADGSEDSHQHEWIRLADGSIRISENAGHSHEVDAATLGVRSDAAQIDQHDSKPHSEGLMKTEKTDKQRADELEGELKVYKAKVAELEALIASNATAAETEAIKREKTRADEAEAKVQRFDETFRDAVRARVKLERQAASVMGPEFRMDDMDDRAIYAAVVKRLDSSADVSASVSIDMLRGQLHALVGKAGENAAAQARVAEILGRTAPEQRNDDQPSYEEYENSRWKKTLSNGRDRAAEGR